MRNETQLTLRALQRPAGAVQQAFSHVVFVEERLVLDSGSVGVDVLVKLGGRDRWASFSIFPVIVGDAGSVKGLQLGTRIDLVGLTVLKVSLPSGGDRFRLRADSVRVKES